MDEREMMGVMESILFVSGEAIPIRRIAEFLNMDIRNARTFMEKLMDVFNFERRGIQIIKANDCFQLATRAEHGEQIEAFFGSDDKQTLSQALLETLSIIAYKQPVTRMDMELIRGVKCEYSVSVLLSKNLIKDMGRLDAPGRPILYGTTDEFLKSFGLTSLDELPALQE